MKTTNIDIILSESLKSDEIPSFDIIQKIKNHALDESVQRRRISSSKHVKRSVIIAATLCLILGLTITAVATNIFGLRDMVIPGTDSQSAYDDIPSGASSQLVSLQGFIGSPEYAASVEWQSFLSAYDVEAFIESVESIWPEDIPELYLQYAISYELAKKVDEILNKYGLVMLGEYLEFASVEEFKESIASGPIFDDESIVIDGYRHKNGTFNFDASFSPSFDNGSLMFQFRASRKGVFDNTVLSVENLDNYVEWNYTNAKGSQLVLAQGEHKSLILLENDNFFITVNVLAGTHGASIGTHPPINRNDLEELADIINFGHIRNDLPALIKYEFPAFVTEEKLINERRQIAAKRAQMVTSNGEKTVLYTQIEGIWLYERSESETGEALPALEQDGIYIQADHYFIKWFGGDEVLNLHLQDEYEALVNMDGARIIDGYLFQSSDNEYMVYPHTLIGYPEDEMLQQSLMSAVLLTHILDSNTLYYTDSDGSNHYFTRTN